MSAHALLNLEGCFALAGLIVLGWRTCIRCSQERRFPNLIPLLPVIAVLAYWRASRFYFLSDDFWLLYHAKAALARAPALFITPGGDGFYRPLGYAIYGVVSIWAGFDPARWHWAAIAIHAVNTLLLFLLARDMDLSRFAAWTGAALFAIYAAHPENVVWMAGAFDLFATFFVLLAAIAFLRGLHVFGLLAMIFGILCKESAYAFPLLALVLAIWQKKRIRAVVPYLLTALALVVFRLWLLRGIGGYGSVNIFSAANALLLRVWAVLFFPINWSMPAGWILLGLAAAYAWLFSAKVQRDRLLLLISFILAAALPPIQQLLIGADLQKSRLLYLPSVGFCLLIGFVAEQRRAAVIPLFAFSFVALWHNLNAWEYTSTRAKAACVTAARCSKPLVYGLPRSLEGVYFFANGFPECVALQNATPTSETCSLTWDPKTATLIQTK